MRTRIAITLVALLLGLGTAAPLAASAKIPASGDFTATVNFATLSLTPVGANCLLEVEAQLDFTGTLEGAAIGTTRALVLAPCADVATNPPGTFKDVFRFEGVFDGTVDSTPVIAALTYQGITEVGGAIKAKILLKNGLHGNLDVEAVVAVGGSYDGFIILP